jgi:hypothetical protein
MGRVEKYENDENGNAKMITQTPEFIKYIIKPL